MSGGTSRGQHWYIHLYPIDGLHSTPFNPIQSHFLQDRPRRVTFGAPSHHSHHKYRRPLGMYFVSDTFPYLHQG